MKTILFITISFLLLLASHEEALPHRKFMCMQLQVLKNGKMVCEQCERCPAGMEPIPECFSNKIWTHGKFVKDCRHCPKGYFKETENDKPTSAPCLRCDSVQCQPFHKVKRECTPTSKRLCSDECINGYRKNKITDECEPHCCKCVSASDEQVKRCQHTPDKHCAPVNGTCQNAYDMKTSSKTEPDSTPSPLFSPADPKRKDMPSQSKGMTQDNQHSTTKPKMTSLDARSQTLTSSHLNSKETAGRASPQSTLTTKPLSQQSVANVTLRSVKLKRKRKPKTTPLNTAKDLTSAKPITTPSVMQTSPTVSTTVMKPDSTALPTGKQPDITVRIILGIFAVALVGLVIWLQSYLRSRQLHVGKNSSRIADTSLELTNTADEPVQLKRSSSYHEESSGKCGTLSRRRSSSSLSSTGSSKDLNQFTSQTEESQSLLAKKPSSSLDIIHEPTYPTIQDTLAVTTCSLCGKRADKLLSSVDQVRLKFGNLSNYLDKKACDEVFWYLFENDGPYTGINEPMDLFDVLVGRLPDITVGSFFEILRLTKKANVVARYHADFHQVTVEDDQDS